ncbi:MAG: SGNH/GDSL hydrolase family protein [Xanthomonadales bacterium]|nr:SGNH/GDSL hydrolase family protein [Xanthomonadales bacterium]
MLDKNNTNIVVALGDSITHATVSASYLKILSKNDKNQQFSFINAGINSRLAYNALQALDTVVACKPSGVIILIGTNDVLATRSEKVAQRYIDQWQLPQTPDFAFYQDNLAKIIEKLQAQTSAKIAIFSLPPLGEKTNSPMNNTVSQYNRFIKDIAIERDITYLPLNERMWQTINEQGGADKACPFTEKLMEKSIAKHYLFNDSWNEISADHHLQLLTDCIHLNENAAVIVAELAQGFLAE